MNDELKNDYKVSVEYWDSVYKKAKDEYDVTMDKIKNWKELAPSEKFLSALSIFSSCDKVLDYGCGNGWCSILMAKLGCREVTAVDLAENSIDVTNMNIRYYGLDKNIRAFPISSDWLIKEETNKYDGFLCSNVLDVVPEEIASGILKEAARVVKPNKKLIIGLNFYLNPDIKLKTQPDIRNNLYVYRDGILRMVNRSDEEWSSIFSEYFKVEKVEHFAWPNETAETRRLFYLVNRKFE